MEYLNVFIGLVVVFTAGAIGYLIPRHPPTYTDQWESVYVVCARNGGDQTEARRVECIAAADRVMKCATEVKP